MANVKHWYGTLTAYNAITTKDGGTLYHTSDGGIYRGVELIASKTVYPRPSADDVSIDSSFIKGVTVFAGDVSAVGTYGIYDTVLTVGPYAWRSFQLKATKSDTNSLLFRSINAQGTAFNGWSSAVLQEADFGVTIPVGTALTFGLDAMPSGAIRFANGASGNESPVIIGKSTSVSTGTGLSFCAGTSETNNTGDMVYNVRRNTGTDFTDMTKEAYRWGRYATNLMTLGRNGLFTLMPATNSLQGASQAAYTHAFSLNAANIPTYSTRRTDSGMGMIIMSMTADNNTAGADMMFNVRNAANADYSSSYRTQVAFRWDRYGDTLMSLARNGALTVNNTVTSTGFYQSSLRSLKKNIRPFIKSALEILNGVDVMTYKYKNDLDNNQQVGIIADDTHELIAGKNHDHFDQGNTVGLLIKAVQELSSKCTRLESELKTLRPC